MLSNLLNKCILQVLKVGRTITLTHATLRIRLVDFVAGSLEEHGAIAIEATSATATNLTLLYNEHAKMIIIA